MHTSYLNKNILNRYFIHISRRFIKLRMEMGNVPKRQQSDRQQQKVTSRSSMQREIPAPGSVLQLAPKQIYTSSVIMNAIINSKWFTRN